MKGRTSLANPMIHPDSAPGPGTLLPLMGRAFENVDG